MRLNGGEHRDYLSGKDEVDAFADKEYVKLHKSTMSKVYWFQRMYFLLQQNKVNVHNKNWSNKVNLFLERPIVKVLGFVAVLFTIFQLIQLGWVRYSSEPNKLASVIKEQSNHANSADAKSRAAD